MDAECGRKRDVSRRRMRTRDTCAAGIGITEATEEERKKGKSRTDIHGISQKSISPRR